MNLIQTAKNKSSRFSLSAILGTSFVIFLFILAGSCYFIKTNARKNFVNSSHDRLSRICQGMNLKFELGLSNQLVLALQLAKSPLIVNYFENPDDKDFKKLAFSEIAAYQKSFLSNLTFMINDNDLKYYSNNECLYTLDKNDSTSDWYMRTMASAKEYEFNVNYDIGLKQTFMWVNGIVRNESGKFLGLIGTGIPISDFIDSLYSSLPEGCTMYIYNRNLETTGSADISNLESKSLITELIPEFQGHEDELSEMSSAFIDKGNRVFAFEPIKEIDWNILVFEDYTFNAFVTGAMVPASICFTIMVFFFFVVGVIIRIRLLHSNEERIGVSILEEIKKLASSSKDTAVIAQEQSAAVKEIVSTMEDNTALSEDISQKIKDVSGDATKSSGEVSAGVDFLEENVRQLQKIESMNLNTISEIKSLGDKIENIWDIVTLINSVADQAKIIAFNAELEASSAGEAGRNFHIVASEIRRLADGIIDGTKEIKERISAIQQSSDSLIVASENGTEMIQKGVENAKNLEERFTSIKDASESTADSAGKITEIIQQQAVASEQILVTLRQIASGAEKFTSATEYVSKSSQKLKSIAEGLNKKKKESDVNKDSKGKPSQAKTSGSL